LFALAPKFLINPKGMHQSLIQIKNHNNLFLPHFDIKINIDMRLRRRAKIPMRFESIQTIHEMINKYILLLFIFTLFCIYSTQLSADLGYVILECMSIFVLLDKWSRRSGFVGDVLDWG
jgi:hypothetical protein